MKQQKLLIIHGLDLFKNLINNQQQCIQLVVDVDVNYMELLVGIAANVNLQIAPNVVFVI